MHAMPQRPNTFRPPFLLFALVAAAGAAAVSCAPDPGVPQVTPPGRVLAECPMDFHEPDSIADTLVLPGRLTRVPEFHDCQRFIVQREKKIFSLTLASWKEYGPLEAIWVRESLAVINFPLPSGGVVPATADSIGMVNPLGETSYFMGGTAAVASGPETIEIGVAVALVYSTAPYAPLGLEPGFNCLYLYNPTDWAAVMVPVSEQKNCSHQNIDPESVQGTKLEVHAVTMPGAANRDYPPVARWDADADGQYFVGIKCMAAWCEIGSGDFGSSPSYQGNRVRGIKGWYDEQYLAVHTTQHPVWPTSILGTAFPDPGLDQLLRDGYTPGQWYHVASTVLRDGPSGGPALAGRFDSYHSKFGYEPGAVATQENEIFFCQGSHAECEVPSPLSCAGPGQGDYWARIVSAQKRDTVYKCVTFTNHGVTMPGVVRWRWVKNDEKNWVSCPSGCCQVNQ